MYKTLISTLSFFLFFSLIVDAQSFGPAIGKEGYYQIDGSTNSKLFTDKSSSCWHFIFTKTADSALFINCTLISFRNETNGQLFASDDPMLKPGSNKDLELLSLLNRPFEYIYKPKEITAQPEIAKIFEESAAAWQLDDNMVNTMRSNATYYLIGEMRMLFPTLPVSPRQLSDTWTSRDSTMHYHVTGRDDRFISYQAVQDIQKNKPQDNLISHTTDSRFNLATGLVVQSTARTVINQPINDNGDKVPLESRASILQVDPKDIKNASIGQDLITAIITASRMSKALIHGPTYDSTKVDSYFRKYDPIYGKENFYRLIKLDLLMGAGLMNNMVKYDSALLQTPDSVIAGSPAHLFNKAQEVIKIDSDSAYQTLKYLSRDKHSFTGWIQESFAQQFLSFDTKEMRSEMKKEGLSDGKIDSIFQESVKSRLIARKLIDKMAHSDDSSIQREVLPLHLWVEASNHAGNKDSVLQIARELQKLSESKNYSNTHRYALLVYKQLLADSNKAAATDMLDGQIASMEKRVSDSTDNDRYAEQNMLAYAYKLKSDELRSSDPKASLAMLSRASGYSPKSQREKAYTSFYDRVFLRSEESYRPEFARALIEQGNSKEGLITLSEQLNSDPAVFGDLQQAFEKYFPQMDFYKFFNDVIVKAWKSAPDFSLKSPDEKRIYKLSDYRGRWLLIDFWGTWCGPCREELPEINKFVQKIKDRKDLAFLSIASRDKPQSVTSYLAEHHFQLPVCMSDQLIDAKFGVTGYPGKFLVSPTGTFLPIGFGEDWQKTVEQFSSIQPKKKESKLARQEKN